jgi:hypothetical protein
MVPKSEKGLREISKNSAYFTFDTAPTPSLLTPHPHLHSSEPLDQAPPSTPTCVPYRSVFFGAVPGVANLNYFSVAEVGAVLSTGGTHPTRFTDHG